ncbi:MAG: sel1 repeat family protein, partial [Gemmatimonadales bacterium]|nr:sel1 repeat family protein [Gemmatimonadales bacterium]
AAAPESAAVTAPAPPATCDAAYHAREWALAFTLCSAAVKANVSDVVANRNLGLLYASGRGVTQDERLATTHLVFAADEADTIAALEMARRYETGKGTAVDQRKASGKYLLAANLGVQEAYPILAQRFADGLGVTKNEAEAAKWWARAAVPPMSHLPSMTRLGAAYMNGRGVKKNEDTGREWYVKAANAGEAEAQYQVAMMLFNGKAKMGKDAGAARGWLDRAARQGHAEAIKELAKRGG